MTDKEAMVAYCQHGKSALFPRTEPCSNPQEMKVTYQGDKVKLLCKKHAALYRHRFLAKVEPKE